MNLYPKILFQKESTLTKDEIKEKLISFMSNGKYEGYWENDFLYLNRIISPNIIIPNIKIELSDKENVRIVNIECDIKKRFKIISVIFFIILSLFEILICVTLIRQKEFNIICIFPLIIGFLGYFIFRFSFSWEANSIKYELIKLLRFI